jgi:hypothetical protein
MATIKIGVITDTHVDITDPAASQEGARDKPGWRLPGNEDQSLPLFVTNANSSIVDIAVNDGDIVNREDASNTALNFQSWDSYVSGLTLGEAHLALGHHDVQGINATGTEYNTVYSSITLPTTDAPVAPWWPTLSPIVTADTSVAYYIEKNGFRIFFLCDVTGVGGVDPDSAGKDSSGDISQIDWFIKHTSGANSTTLPIVVFQHNPSLASSLTTQLEAISNTVVVILGHTHVTQSFTQTNGITYIQLRGDVWGKSDTDITRFSHAIIDITAPAYTDGTRDQGLITVTGYGYQGTVDMSTVLVTRWKLNEATGETTIVDAQGFSNGTASAAVTSVIGPVDEKALIFDGTDYVTGTDELVVAYPFTLSCWIKIDASPALSSIALSIGAALSTNNMSLGINSDGTGRFAVKAGGGNQDVNSAINIADAKWHQLTGVAASATDRKLYVDGVLDGTETTSKNIFSSTIDLWGIGRRESSAPGSTFEGSIDDARVYSGALTAQQAKQLYSDQLYRNPEYQKDYNKLQDDDIFGRSNGAQYEDNQNDLYNSGKNIQYEG